jgi:tetratricopeptide (TPR) repeat protein
LIGRVLGHHSPRAVFTDLLAMLPGLLAVAVFVAWSGSDGGYLPTDWYPGALFLLALIAVVAGITWESFEPLPRPVLWALGLLAAFTAWNFLSIAWAQVHGDAWDGANRTLLYLTVFALFAHWPWRRRAAAAILGAFSLGITAVGIAVLLKAALAADPASYFIGGRYAKPMGYTNANTALWMMAFWPALFFASRPESRWLTRGLALAAAGALLELALLPQTTGLLFAAPVVALAYFVFVPGRVRSLAAVLALAAALLALSGPVRDVWPIARAGGDLASAIDDAALAIALSAVALFAVGCAWGLVERRLAFSARTTRRMRGGVAAASAVAAIAGVIALINGIGSPTGWADDRWHDFSRGQAMDARPGGFAGGLGSNRQDFWRVGIDQFVDSPLLGAGSDNFAVDYLKERRTREEPLHPHSLEVRVLGQTGMVGALLFAGFLAAAFLAAARAWSRARADPLARGLIAIAGVVFLYWLAHGSGDWFWEFPALGGPAFAFLGMATGVGVRELRFTPVRRTPRFGSLGGVVLLLALAAGVPAAISYTLPWRSASEVKAALREWEERPAAATDRLSRARKLNILSDRPDLVAGAIAQAQGQPNRARESYARAVSRNGADWYARLQLALFDYGRGRRADALAQLRRARALNPLEPTIALAISRVRAGRRILPESIRLILVARNAQRGL